MNATYWVIGFFSTKNAGIQQNNGCNSGKKKVYYAVSFQI